jgi:hypothetical protein
MKDKEWEKTWESNRERLINMLNVHNFPEEEKKKVLQGFTVGFENKNAYNMIRCIDLSLGWGASHFGYDFYYFLQMRFAYYMCYYAHTNDEKKMAVKYLGELSRGYKSTPSWQYWYNNPVEAKLKTKPGDLILTTDKYKPRKAFFKQKFEILSKKFGIKE